MGKSKLRTQELQRLAVAAADNKSLRVIERELGIPASTARHNLKRPEVQDMVEKAREKLAEQWQNVAERALAHISDKKLESSSASQLGVIAGIGSEKTMLLRGGPNGQGVHVTINIGDPTQRVERSIDVTGVSGNDG